MTDTRPSEPALGLSIQRGQAGHAELGCCQSRFGDEFCRTSFSLPAPPPDLLADLERESKVRRVSRSALVCESVEAALRPRSRRGAASCYDLARDLAGTVTGLPRDLASNPKYMDGFGE
jgi:hypothetical protein